MEGRPGFLGTSRDYQAEMKKLYYIANIRLPTERAHGIQIMKMCESLAGQTQVELVVTNRTSKIKEDPFSYYGVKRNFRIKRFWCLDSVKIGKIGFRIETMSFIMGALPYLLSRKGIFYTRDESMAFLLKLFGKQVVWEVHMGQRNILAKLIVKMGVPLVVISHALKNLYPAARRMLVAPDAVDLEQFDISLMRREAREKLGLDPNKKLVVYTGSRQSWKGVETLEAATKFLPTDMETMIIMGKSQAEIPAYLKAADVLVIPNSDKQAISRLYTSPMKLFEYMASGTPIVASNLPSLREIVDDSMASFFAPDNPESLAKTIEQVFSDYSQAEKKADVALERVKEYSWKNRAESILHFLHV